MFRYNTQSQQLRSFKVNPDDRTIQARCKGRNHEFAVNANMCAGNHLFLGPILLSHTISPQLRNKFRHGEDWKFVPPNDMKDFEE